MSIIAQLVQAARGLEDAPEMHSSYQLSLNLPNGSINRRNDFFKMTNDFDLQTLSPISLETFMKIDSCYRPDDSYNQVLRILSNLSTVQNGGDFI